MDAPRSLLVIVAHPDDESFGCGALISGAARQGARVTVCCASRGELGEDATGRYPTTTDLAAAREQELRESAQILGAAGVEFLGFSDSGWDGDVAAGSIVAERERLVGSIEHAIEKLRPGVVVTMDPTGSDGHRDHVAVAEATTEAFFRAVDWPASLYHWCLPHSLMDDWAREVAARDPNSVYLGTELGRPDSEVTTVLDGTAELERVRRAMSRHATQTGPYQGISSELADRFIGFDHLVRVHPQWTIGPKEAGLHWPEPAGPHP